MKVSQIANLNQDLALGYITIEIAEILSYLGVWEWRRYNELKDESVTAKDDKMGIEVS